MSSPRPKPRRAAPLALLPWSGPDWEGVGVKPDIEVPAAHAQVLVLQAVARALDEHLRGTLHLALDAAQRELDALREPKS